MADANIVSLKIKNFLSISDVEVRPGKITQIIGRNSQGKTSILKALEFAINGSTDGKLVKFGEESSEVIVELSDGTNIRRRIGMDGKQNVEVKRDEFKVSSPQTYLERLFDHASFNPIELLERKNRKEAILSSLNIKIGKDWLASELELSPDELPPLDFNDHALTVVDECRAYFYKRRAEANRDAEGKKKRYETYSADLKVIDTKPEVSIEELTKMKATISEVISKINAELNGIDTHQRAADQKQDYAQKCKDRVDQLKLEKDKINANIGILAKQIEVLQGQVNVLDGRIKDGEAVTAKEFTVAKSALDSVPDAGSLKLNRARAEAGLAELNAKMKEVETYDSVSKQAGMIGQMKEEWQIAAAYSEALNRKVNKLSGPMQQGLIEANEMPVPNLQFLNDEFLVDGVPVDNLSSSMALKLAIGIARKLSKKTKIICIDGLERLDNDMYEALREEIEGDGFNYFVTCVGEGFSSMIDDVKLRMNHGEATVMQ